MITRKSKTEIETMRQAGIVVAEIHEMCRQEAKQGVSTARLDAMSEEICRNAGGIPTFKGYQGFPATICASINEEVVHGIPSKNRFLEYGDIFTVDVGVTLDGLVADAAITVGVGEITTEAQRLLDDTEKSLYIGIEQARAGNRIHDIGAAIEEFANERGYGIVREYGGHGVGHRLHEEPHIPNHGRAGTGPRIKEGYCLCIEPMLNLGSDSVKTLADHWTVVTEDGKLSAHFEHCFAVTAQGILILSLPEDAPQPFLD